jgi:hypothetical protein
MPRGSDQYGHVAVEETSHARFVEFNPRPPQCRAAPTHRAIKLIAKIGRAGWKQDQHRPQGPSGITSIETDLTRIIPLCQVWTYFRGVATSLEPTPHGILVAKCSAAHHPLWPIGEGRIQVIFRSARRSTDYSCYHAMLPQLNRVREIVSARRDNRPASVHFTPCFVGCATNPGAATSRIPRK